MIWKYIGSSCIGTSHEDNREGCQDNCYFSVITSPNRGDYFLGLVSDGAGSALRGAEGAEISCDIAKKLIEEWLMGLEVSSDLKDSVVVDWVMEISNSIGELAQKNGLVPRDFACTLLGALVGSEFAIFFQIGDGAIVFRHEKEFCHVFWPENGEYPNMTHFVTDEDYLEHLRAHITHSPPDEIAMFTDGLQMLTLVYKSQTVHKPFFDPMFKALRAIEQERCEQLNDELTIFLTSSSVNQRTDDDKTLILATRLNILPEEN